MRSAEIGKSGAYHALGILLVVSFFNFMDRYLLAILLPAIKTDLDLSDTQIGFIAGFAFTIFYATLGIPIARLADKHSRPLIITIALAFWSLMTAACGMAQNFLQLAVARILVGVGEAGSNPPSYSLVADYFPANRRATALAIMSMGGPIGIFVGFSLGAWLSEAFSWRVALISVSLPGLLAAAYVYLRLEERPRGHADGVQISEEIPALRVVIRLLFSKPAFLHTCVAAGLYTLVLMAVIQWSPSFFTRSHQMSIGQVSTWLAPILGASQFIGIFCGGYLADRLGRRNLSWYAWLPGLAILCSTPLYLITFLSNDSDLALASLFLPLTMGIMQAAPSMAIAQGVADPRMRAMAAAILLLIVNFIGGGLGPQTVGILSDAWSESQGADSLRYALLVVILVAGFWSTIHYYFAGRSLASELKMTG